MTIKFNLKIIVPVVISLTAVLLTSGMFLLCQPFWKAAEDAEKKEATYRQEITTAQDILSFQNAKGVSARLIVQDKISSVMDAVKKSATKNGLSFTLLRPPFTARDEGTLFSRVLFDVQTTGSLRNLGQFFSEVRGMPEGLVDVESLYLTPNEKGAKLITAKSTFVLFVAKNNAKK